MKPFNSELEAGLRAVVVLDALYPRACSLTEVVWFDYLVVHSSDLDGPESLHPDLPARGGELLVRRRLVHDSLKMMHRMHLVDELYPPHGVVFRASEDAPSFIDMLQADYSLRLKERAGWISDRYRDTDSTAIEHEVGQRLGRWTAEFLVSGQPGELYA